MTGGNVHRGSRRAGAPPLPRSFAAIGPYAILLAGAAVAPAGAWTVGQTLDHLARAIEASLGPPLGGFRMWPWPKRTVARFLVLRFGFVPRGVPTAAAMLPPVEVSPDAAAERLSRAVAAFVEHSGERLSPHPLMGFSSKRAWEQFHLVHARHHFRICACPPRR